MASLTSLKVTGLVGATLIAIACSGDDIADCDEKRTCPGSGGGGTGEAGQPGSEGGEAGQSAQGGAAGQSAEGGAAGAGPQCTSDDDCDDDEPRNGIETCEAGACVAGNPPPYVWAITPEDMEMSAEPDGSVTIEFSEDVDPETVNADTVKVLDGDVEVEGTLTLEDGIAIFTPALRLGLLATYTVFVSAEVTDLEGAPMRADFSSEFTVRDGIWSEVMPVEGPEVNLGLSDACLGGDGYGNALVIWQERVGGDTINQISGRWYRNAEWEDPIVLATSASGELTDFSCAVNTRGEAIVAWTSAGTDLFARQYRGGIWEPQGLDIDLDTPVGPMKVGMSPIGEAHVIWAAFGFQRARSTSSAGAWRPETQVIGRGFYGAPQIAIDSAGNAFAAWRDQNVSDCDTVNVAQYLTSTGAWYPGEVLPESASIDVDLRRGSPAIASGDTGEAMAVWVSQTSVSAFDVVSSHFSSGSWSNPAVLSLITGDALLSAPPGLVSDGTRFVAAWSQHEGLGDELYRGRFAGGAWVSEFVASAGAPDRVPVLARDPHGNLLLIWPGTPPSFTSKLSYQRYTSRTSTWSEALDVGGVMINGAVPLLAVAASGTAIAIWTDRDTPGYGGEPLGIFATVFR